VTGAGQTFFVNAGEMHTGEAARTQGYVYRTMYPRATLLEQTALEGHRQANTAGAPDRRTHELWGRAREYIHSHYAAEVSLHELATVAGLSPFHLARSFEREVGQPPHLYLVAVSTMRRFKRLLGITPGQFARERRSSGHEAGRRNVPSNRACVAS